MKNLEHLSDFELLTSTQALAQEERRLTTEVLWHIREVEKRRLFATRGYSSLFEYVVQELGYSESAASRRINSMRLLKEIPQIEEALKKGSLNLSTVSAVQTFLSKEKRNEGKTYTQEEKIELLQSVENKSRRECDKILMGISPQSAVPQERERVVSENLTEIRFLAQEELIEKLNRLRGLLAHKNSNFTYAELIDQLAEMALDKVDLERRDQKKNAQKTDDRAMVGNSSNKNGPGSEIETSRGGKIKSTTSAVFTSLPPAEVKRPGDQKPLNQSRYIPVEMQKQVWFRDRGMCTYKDPQAGRRCGSKFKLQFDHITPVALGGLTVFENLRLLCAQHNRLMAIEKLGPRKMSTYLRDR